LWGERRSKKRFDQNHGEAFGDRTTRIEGEQIAYKGSWLRADDRSEGAKATAPCPVPSGNHLRRCHSGRTRNCKKGKKRRIVYKTGPTDSESEDASTLIGEMKREEELSVGPKTAKKKLRKRGNL